MFNNSWFKKEKPLPSLIGLGGGATKIQSQVVAPKGMDASGGIINDYPSGSDIYRAHIFTGSGTFTINALSEESPAYPNAVEYLVVAGGGGGFSAASSADGMGGGGAGGLRTNLSGHPMAGSAFPIPGTGSYTVTVAEGGRGGVHPGPGSPQPWNPFAAGSKGLSSSFGPTITGYGGGQGRYDAPTSNLDPKGGGPGGSGGGLTGGNGTGGGEGNQPPVSPSQGNDGGSRGPNYGSGGGGGAGAVGADASPTDAPGAGGIGVQVAIAGPPTASPVGTPGPSGNGWFAGGGGGCAAGPY